LAGQREPAADIAQRAETIARLIIDLPKQADTLGRVAGVLAIAGPTSRQWNYPIGSPTQLRFPKAWTHTLTVLILVSPASRWCHVTTGAQALSRWSPRRVSARAADLGATPHSPRPAPNQVRILRTTYPIP
jgi:hypothetical protein